MSFDSLTVYILLAIAVCSLGMAGTYLFKKSYFNMALWTLMTVTLVMVAYDDVFETRYGIYPLAATLSLRIVQLVRNNGKRKIV